MIMERKALIRHLGNSDGLEGSIYVTSKETNIDRRITQDCSKYEADNHCSTSTLTETAIRIRESRQLIIKEKEILLGVYDEKCPRTSEERQPLSADHGTPAGISGQLVDTNLDTSDPDTYTSPHAPLPYDVDVGHPRIQHGTRDYPGAKSGIIPEIAHSSSGEAPTDANPSGKLEMGLKDTGGKVESMLELTSSMILEDDLKKPVEAVVVIEEEDCPICLEDYTEENPKLLTKCEHHFHLCCILEWMERSDACPVCDQEVVIDETLIGT